MTAPTIERPVKPAPVDLHKRNRTSHLQWVKIADIVPCPRAQREFKPGWAAELAAHFDLEGLGFLVVNKRDGHTYCIDGQHRIAALRAIGFSEDTVQCEVYEGLSEKEEARMFLRRNNSKQVAAFDKFNVALTGEYEEESTIRRLMLAQGIGISRSGVSCVTSLRRAFQRQHEAGFSKTIRVIRDAYGDVGFRAAVIDGVSLFLHRYDGQVDEGLAVSRLSATHAGVNGLLGLASVSERSITQQPLVQCIAATATAIYNRDARGNAKLAPWWKS
jgi:hypothetical protein